MNTYEYESVTGTRKGKFNIYQSVGGGIMITMANRYTELTRNQLNDLQIDLYALIDFDHDQFIVHYGCHADRV